MAKEQKQENPPPVPEVPEVVGPPKSYRLYIALGFVSLILFQVIVVLLIMPAKQESPLSGVGPRDGTDFGDVPDHRPIIRKEPMVERPIGTNNSFKIRTPAGNDLNSSFNLVMHVRIRSADARAFDKGYADNMILVIDRATSVLRAATIEERDEANHTAIKARLKKAINEVLENTWVQEVLFVEVTHEVT